MRILPIARHTLQSSSLVVLFAACGGDSTAPQPPLEFASVQPTYFRTCGVTTDGGAYCWGIEDYNVDPDSIIHTTPSRVSGSTGLQFPGGRSRCPR
ncbi:MAG TPA: hypothetical protein VGQ48_06965 [Gemmatimonadales bacterium]|jgi:hypothetical protein|nr:hypothetical protein [Gemmatimonadales bacterium]